MVKGEAMRRRAKNYIEAKVGCFRPMFEGTAVAAISISLSMILHNPGDKVRKAAASAATPRSRNEERQEDQRYTSLSAEDA